MNWANQPTNKQTRTGVLLIIKRLPTQHLLTQWEPPARRRRPPAAAPPPPFTPQQPPIGLLLASCQQRRWYRPRIWTASGISHRATPACCRRCINTTASRASSSRTWRRPRSTPRPSRPRRHGACAISREFGSICVRGPESYHHFSGRVGGPSGRTGSCTGPRLSYRPRRRRSRRRL